MIRTHPGLAAVFSFIIPGLGQVYNGNFAKAFWVIIACLVGAVLSHAFIGIFILIPAWAYGIFDAYESADDPYGKSRSVEKK